MRSFTFIFCFGIIVTVALASTSDNLEAIRQVVEIHRLRPQSDVADYPVPQLNYCLSWRLAVETNNLRDWLLVPSQCQDYVGRYMGKQYRRDCEFVANEAIQYAKGLKLGGDGKDVWVFDVDDAVLSNLPFFARPDVVFGTLTLATPEYSEWIANGTLPAIPSMLNVYNTVLSLGIKTVLLTGAGENVREKRAANLNNAGYSNWLKLILRGPNDSFSAVVYKSSKRTELVQAGYRIVGNLGDQWTDLTGENAGARTFKVPNPMYYIG